MHDKNNKLAICLIKLEYTSFDQIIAPEAISVEIENVGTFYAEDSRVGKPGWVQDFFGNSLDGKFSFLTASARGVLLSTVETDIGEKRNFAVIFGHGRHLLNNGVIEERFGLKVVLNSVDSKSLRSIDKTTLGSIPKQSREQISKAGAAANFGIDIEQDLLGSVTGKSRDSRFGKTITGKDSLSVSVKIDAKNIVDFLSVCLERYQAEDYIKEGFGWVDQIQDIRDRKTVQDLNDILVGRLNGKTFEKIWMAAPDILDWVDVKGFSYLKSKSGILVDDLDTMAFISALELDELTLDDLSRARVFAFSSKNDEIIDGWSAYNCIYAEIEYDGRIFILHNGKWYQIAKSFTDEIAEAFHKIPESAIALPIYSHDNEGIYNKALEEALPGSICLDCNLIYHGGGHSSVEFCDLWTPNNQFVHVKRYSGSQQLSHLFAQGVIAGELFAEDPQFREKLNEKLPDSHKISDTAPRPDTGKYEIIFAIISKSDNPLDIPFFSKVSLRNAQRRLKGYGYPVSIKKITRIAA